MNFRDLADKAKKALKGEHVDKAADAAKQRFGQHSDKIDKVADRARKFVDSDEAAKGRQDPGGTGMGPGQAGGRGPGEPGGTGQPLP